MFNDVKAHTQKIEPGCDNWGFVLEELSLDSQIDVLHYASKITYWACLLISSFTSTNIRMQYIMSIANGPQMLHNNVDPDSHHIDNKFKEVLDYIRPETIVLEKQAGSIKYSSKR